MILQFLVDKKYVKFTELKGDVKFHENIPKLINDVIELSNQIELNYEKTVFNDILNALVTSNQGGGSFKRKTKRTDTVGLIWKWKLFFLQHL
jgi:hypothetical protein